VSFWEKMERLDRRVIYVLLIAAVAFALIKPVGLAITISKETQATYDLFDGLPPGSIVWIGCEYGASNITELQPILTCVLRQGLAKDLRFITGGMWAQAGNLAESAWEDVSADFPDKQYGIDFVNVGYRPGGERLLPALVADAHEALMGRDNRGTSLDDLPLMQEFKSLTDAAAILVLVSGTPGEKEYIRLVTDQHGIPIVAGAVSVSVPEAMPLLNSGQLKGLVMGMAGAAEYEVLIGKPGSAVAGMDAQSFAHVLIILFIVLGNLGHIALGKHKKKA